MIISRELELVICKHCSKETIKPKRHDNKEQLFCDRKCFGKWFSINGKRRYGSDNPAWKGDKSCYTTKHQWISRHYGKAIMCWHPNCNNQSKSYEWANINHRYKKNINEWLMLCQSCHSKFDKSYINRKRNKYGQFSSN